MPSETGSSCFYSTVAMRAVVVITNIKSSPGSGHDERAKLERGCRGGIGARELASAVKQLLVAAAIALHVNAHFFVAVTHNVWRIGK